MRFTLPRGYVDERGTLHREGTMRLATARDEIEPLRDPRCARTTPTFGAAARPGRHPARHGHRHHAAAGRALFAADFDHLQKLYERLNTDGEWVGSVSCPQCSRQFEIDLSEIEEVPLGE